MLSTITASKSILKNTEKCLVRKQKHKHYEFQISGYIKPWYEERRWGFKKLILKYNV